MGDSRAFLQLFLTLTKIGYFISDQYPIGLLKVPKYRTISGHGVIFKKVDTMLGYVGPPTHNLGGETSPPPSPHPITWNTYTYIVAIRILNIMQVTSHQSLLVTDDIITSLLTVSAIST
jgi:hypothetical protein